MKRLNNPCPNCNIVDMGIWPKYDVCRECHDKNLVTNTTDVYATAASPAAMQTQAYVGKSTPSLISMGPLMRGAASDKIFAPGMRVRRTCPDGFGLLIEGGIYIVDKVDPINPFHIELVGILNPDQPRYSWYTGCFERAD